MAKGPKPPSAAQSFTVPAADPDFATFAVKAGETWRLRAHGRWRDAWIPCGPGGYRNFLFDVLEVHPRESDARWFCLMGVVDGHPGSAFAIGPGCTKTFDHDGELHVFANDQLKHYGNNHGCITLTAEPVLPVPDPEGVCPPDPPSVSRTLGEATDWFTQTWRGFRVGLDQTAGILFVATLVIGVSAILLALQQGRDLILSVGEDALYPFGPQNVRQAAFALGLLFMAIQGWFWPRMIIESTYGRDRRKWRPQWLLTWTPRLVAMAPFVLVGIALKTNSAPNTIFVLGLLALAAGLLFYLIRRNDFEDDRKTQALRDDKAYRPLFGRGWALFGLILAAASMLVAIVWHVEPERLIGAPAVVFLGIGLIIPVVVVVSQLGGDFRLPLLGAALCAAAVFSLWMDNHSVGRRDFQHPVTGPVAQVDLTTAYTAWKAQNPPRDGARTPIVIVAAEGGASRAGFWTGEVLSALRRDVGPNFDKSLFAISSVSGGSVGAVGYVAALREDPTPDALIDPNKIEGRVSAFAGADALSPDMGALLFPDLAQRFLPIALLPDRAQALEESWEAAWREGCPKASKTCDRDLIAQPFLGLWSDMEPKDWKRPLVIVNGASEETGRRILTSRLNLNWKEGAKAKGRKIIDADNFQLRNGGQDVAASTAIHNGARFPWISPAGRLPDGGHILDGGYFDTEGVETVRELARAIKAVAPASDNLEFIVIQIHYESREKAKPKKDVFINEVMAPLLGIFASRDAHGAHMVESLRNDVSPQGVLPGRYFQITLHDPPNFEEPLDWALSQRAQAYMRCAAGFAPKPKDPSCGADDYEAANRTAIAMVKTMLTPTASAVPR